MLRRMIVTEGTVAILITLRPVIEAGDVIDVIILHKDDSSLSLLAGEELSVL